ncbi:MAG: TIGR03619 family F420-dependent LLM class oxidoreductase [Mycobacteriaceae bacterium]|nr:TIGR03619 family F420-dependent LLM class oxidoreductase [Mycobacteriaceae bacterium]
MPQFGQSARDDLVRFASTAEDLGAASLWVGDRLLAPVNPTVGYGGTDTIPDQMRTSFDPFVALAVAAAVTQKAQLGTSVLVAPWYPPVQLGRQLTSIDVVSGGRLITGLGIGWSPDEYQAAGAPFGRRGAQLDELMDALIELWTSSPAEHDGRRWSVPPSWVDLKPVQQPHPPIYLGAFTPASLGRLGRRADGWLAVVQVPGGVHPEALGWQRQQIDAAAVAAGRDPASIATNVRINVASGCTVAEVADVVRLLADNGYTDLFVDLMYVASGVDAMLDWAQQLLAASAR